MNHTDRDKLILKMRCYPFEELSREDNDLIISDLRRIDRLEKALKDYGVHQEHCVCFGDETCRSVDCKNCDCGLAEALEVRDE